MNWPRYAKYKDSGVEWLGEVPAHWDLMKLKWIARLRSGETIAPDQIGDSGEFPVFGGNGLRGFTAAYTHEGEYPLVGRQGALCGNINYASGKFWASEHAVVATPSDGVCTRWLGEVLRSMDLNQYSTSAAQPGLSVDVISNLVVATPPGDEQQAIAAFLDRQTAKIDALIAEQEKLIALLKEKRQALLSHAVTKGLDPNAPMKDSGIEWLGQVPAHWKIVRLKRIVVFQRGHDLPAESREVGEVPVVSSGGRIGYHAHAIAKAPGIVTGRYGSIGQFNLIDEDYWPLNTALYSINLCGNHPRYVWYLLQSLSEHFRINSMKSAVPGIDRNDIHEVLAVLAPLGEQEYVATFLDRESQAIDRLINESARAIALLNERRAALISAAVTGKIDVRDKAASNKQDESRAVAGLMGQEA